MASRATDFSIETLRARRTNKWHKFAPDVLPAWVADMDFGVAPPVTAALQRLTDNQEYGYAAREGVLAAAFVRRMRSRFGWETKAADVLAIGDLVQATFSSVMAFSEPGDAILLQLPSYPPFMSAIHDTGRRLLANPMRDNGTRWVLDLAAYEAAPDPRGAGPEDPGADLLPPAEPHRTRVQPGGTGGGRRVRHPPRPGGDLGRDPRRHRLSRQHPHSPGLAEPGDRRAHHHHHLGDQELQHSGATVCRDVFRDTRPEGPLLRPHPGVTGVDATVAAWDDGQPWFDEIMAQLQANRDWLAQTIGSELPGVTMRLPEATYLAWLDCTALKLPCSAGQFFLDKARVGLNFGETFGPHYGGARMAAAVR